jgi:hypothetical protein
MDHFKTYNNFLVESSLKKKGIIFAYHLSNQLEHMENSDFRMEYASEFALFGKAIYFSSTPNINYKPMNEGKKTYCCKFEITLDEPVLDMNRIIPVYEGNRLLRDFITLVEDEDKDENNSELYKFRGYNFDHDFENTMLVGEVFETITSKCNWELNKYYDFFIRKWLGYNSFKYFQNSWTDFETEKGDYGISYGLYNPKSIRFVDGPF